MDLETSFHVKEMASLHHLEGSQELDKMTLKLNVRDLWMGQVDGITLTKGHQLKVFRGQQGDRCGSFVVKRFDRSFPHGLVSDRLHKLDRGVVSTSHHLIQRIDRLFHCLQELLQLDLFDCLAVSVLGERRRRRRRRRQRGNRPESKERRTMSTSKI